MAMFDTRLKHELGSEDVKRVDWTLFFTIILISLLGIINLYSISLDSNIPQGLVTKQLVFFGVGFLFIVVSLLFDYRILEHFAYIIYGINLLLILGTRYFGMLRNGHRLWYNLGVIAYQPAETMKLAMIRTLAKYFHGREYVESLGWRDLKGPLLIVGLAAGATFSQPDTGTGMHILLIGFTTILFFGVRRNIILSALMFVALAFPLGWKFVFKEYQKDRVRVMFDPMSDPRGRGYNSLQAMIAVGSGQFSGKGFKQGTQTQLGFTPEGYTDFIFTVVAEEWGWLGCVFVLGLYCLLVYRCIWAAAHSREKFGSLVAVGVAALIAYQVLINVSMVIGLFPIVGIPLPLASYGGSSVITVCIALGLALNIGYRRIMF
jgi:rod shape determining protein RodA